MGAIIFCEYFEIDLLVYFCSFQEDDDESVNENDAELVKQIEKQRRRAVAAVGDESLLPQEIPARLRVANPPTIPKSKSN